MKTATPLLASLLLFGCSPPLLRGDFSLLSVEPLGSKVTVLSQHPVKGRACFNMPKAAVFLGDGVFDAAVADALKRHEGATVLVGAAFIDEGSCVEVSGLPATF